MSTLAKFWIIILGLIGLVFAVYLNRHSGVRVRGGSNVQAQVDASEINRPKLGAQENIRERPAQVMTGSPRESKGSSKDESFDGDESKLLIEFDAANINEKVRIANELIKLGGEKSAIAFIREIKSNRTNLTLSTQEILLVDTLIRGLANLSLSSKVAESFLIDGLDLEFWTNIRTWKSADDKWEDQSLAGRCLVTLSMLRSPIAIRFIDEREQLKPEWSAFVVDSAFNIEMIDRFGQAEWMAEAPGRRFHLFMEWEKSGRGADLTKWFRKLNNIP